MTENKTVKSRTRRIKGLGWLRWVIGIPVTLFLLLLAASYLLDEPLRAMLEQRMNRNLKGYSVRLQGSHLQLIGLALTLKELSVVQQAHPETPVAQFPVIEASIHWREVLSGRLVAEFVLDRPKININLKQLRSEAASKVSLKERGWQQAVAEIYPLKINALTVNDASITYVDQDPKRPLTLSHLNLQADNIRNIDLPGQLYPSKFHLDTAIFATGRGSIDGNANFLSRPFPGIKGRVKLDQVPLDYFRPVAARTNLSIEGGLLRAFGNAEYSPKVKTAHLENLTIQGMKIDYIHTRRTAGAEVKRATAVAKNARKLSNKQGILIRADQVNLTACTLGMVNNAAKKPYRLFLADTDMRLGNFSNQFSRGPAHAQVKGKFMGSGRTTASADFRPAQAGPDFDLFVKVEDAQLTALNNVLRSHGDFDVTAGFFSLTTEIHIKNDQISGYMKPFFRDMNVYDKRQDSGRSISHQIYEILVGGVSTVLENRPHQEVATRINISGSVKDPETSSWQIAVQLVRNAFFQAILPGYDK